MTIDGAAAVTRARRQKTNTFGMCLATVWEWYGSPHTLGPQPGRSFATATDSYNYTTKRHPGDYNPPAGVPVWFGVSPTRWDANKYAGDVCLSVGGGRVRCTDAGPNGVVGEMTIRQRAAEIARPYLGWSEDFGGQEIDWPGKHKTTPTKPSAPATTFEEDDIMALKDRIFIYVDTKHPYYEVLPGDVRRQISSAGWGVLRAASAVLKQPITLIKVSSANYTKLTGRKL